MIPVDEPQQVAIVIGIAAALGAIGGLAAELLLHNAAGRLEMPRTLKDSWDLGWIANVLLGAIAAAAFLWVVPPGTTTLDGTEVAAYELRTVVGASLVVGSAGGAILAALQERAKSLANEKQVQIVTNVAVDAVSGLRPATMADNVDAKVSAAQIETALTAIRAAGERPVDE